MYFDARVLIGLMFTFMGMILVALGFATSGNAALYAKSLGVNINLWWGLVIAVFGQAMYHLGRRAQLRSEGEQPPAIQKKSRRSAR
ncbi:MAG TPA: hypothetical protein VKB38_16940 [Terracidiphilus sp.]|nr:hypothetical protein [Terracidiphilus sp.]